MTSHNKLTLFLNDKIENHTITEIRSSQNIVTNP